MQLIISIIWNIRIIYKVLTFIYDNIEWKMLSFKINWQFVKRYHENQKTKLRVLKKIYENKWNFKF
jgi:hypothetical protein